MHQGTSPPEKGTVDLRGARPVQWISHLFIFMKGTLLAVTIDYYSD